MSLYIIRIKGKYQPPRGWQSSPEDEAPIEQPLEKIIIRPGFIYWYKVYGTASDFRTSFNTQ